MGLTVYRPQSELMADGIKPLENRGWAPMEWMLGRYIALHASTRWDQEYADYIERNRHRLRIPGAPRVEACKVGIIGVAQLVGWVENRPTGIAVVKMLPGHAFTEPDFRWADGAQFGWLLRDMRRFSPIPMKGKQKLWPLDPKTYDLVKQRYARAEKHAAQIVTQAFEKIHPPQVGP